MRIQSQYIVIESVSQTSIFKRKEKIEISIINLVGCVNESSLTRKNFVGCPTSNSEIKVFHTVC